LRLISLTVKDFFFFSNIGSKIQKEDEFEMISSSFKYKLVYSLIL
jgi:hypothetical protein